MKPTLKLEFQVKFLQYLHKRQKETEEGFTLIELLVVVIIVSVLASLALPSLLGQINKAKQAEPKNYIGTINRMQQAFYLENSRFAVSSIELQVGINSQTTNYQYGINTPVSGSGDYSVFVAANLSNTLKNYYSLVGVSRIGSITSEGLTVAIACESPTPQQKTDINTLNILCWFPLLDGQAPVLLMLIM